MVCKSIVALKLICVCISLYYTIKSYVKAMGLYNFIRVFGWAYKRGVRGGGDFIQGGIYAE